MSRCKSLTALGVLLVALATMLTPHVARAATPMITLLAPTEAARPDSARPTFMWRLDPAVEGVTFSITIKNLDLDRMRIGKVVFAQAVFGFYNEATGNYEAPYPAALPTLDADHTYAWSIKAMSSTGNVLAKSGPGLAAFFPQWSFCLLFPMNPIIDVCGGSTFTLSAWPLMTGSGNWNWVLTGGGSTLSGNTSTPGQLNLTVPTPPPGTYTYSLKVTRGTCTQTVPYTVTVYPALAAQVLDYPSGGSLGTPPQICITGADATLVVPNLPAGLTVSWDWNDNSSSGPWTGAGTGSLGVGNPKNTNAITPNCGGATGLPSFVKRWFRATISGGTWPCGPLLVGLKVYCPTVPGTVHSSIGTQICSNKSAALNPYPMPLNISLSGPVVGVIGNWSRSPGVIPLHTGQIFFPDTIPAAGTYTYTVTVQNGPCVSATASITIKVEDPLVATITGDKTEVCPNDQAGLNVTNTLPFGTTLQWQYQIDSNPCDPNGVWINSGVTGTHQNTNAIGNLGPYSPAPTTSICWRVIETSASGICGPATSNMWHIDIIQAPCVPTIALVPPGNLPKCPGTSVTLHATMAPNCGTGPFTWEWRLNGVLQSVVGPNASNTSPPFIATAPGNYTVKVFNKNLCDSAISKPFVVADCINTLFIEGPCTASGSTSVGLTAHPSSTCGGEYTYLWTGDGVPTNTTTASITVIPTQTTTYTVAVTDGHGCVTSASITVKVCK